MTHKIDLHAFSYNLLRQEARATPPLLVLWGSFSGSSFPTAIRISIWLFEVLMLSSSVVS